MTIEAISAPASKPLASSLDSDSFRWMRLLAVGATAIVFIAACQTDPRPGLNGSHLAVGVALVTLAVGTLAVIRVHGAAKAVQAALLAAVVLAAALLADLQPSGLGFLGVFPAVSAAALLLTERYAVVVAGFAIAALSIAGGIGSSHQPALGILLHDFAVSAFFLLAVFVRRYREANDHARRLIAELNETRGAQAQAAALAERQRLAREIHDVLAHALSGLAINLESARLIAERTGADLRVPEAIGRGQRLAKAGLEEARRAVGMLRDDALPGPERLALLAAEFESDTGVDCSFTMDGAPQDLRSDARLTVYRVAQEALTNIRKHARPERVEIRLVCQAAGTTLTIEDHRSDAGPPPSGRHGTGYGLTGMRERAELLGGTLIATSTPYGFRVALWIPS